MNGSPYIITGIFAIGIAAAAPEESRALTTEVCALFAMLFQSVRDLTRSYIQNFPWYSRSLLESAGIDDFYFQRSVGGNITLAAALLAMFADFHLVILTFEGILGKNSESLPLFAKADVPLTISLALICGSVTIGIALLDLLGYTHWLPLKLSRRHSKKALAVVCILLLGAFVALYALVAARHQMSALSGGTDAEAIKAGISSTLKSPLVLYLYCYLAILCSMTSILGFACFTAALASWIIAVLAVLIVPAGIICVIGILCDRILTHLYNILLRILSLIQAIVVLIERQMKKNVRSADGSGNDDKPPSDSAEASQNLPQNTREHLFETSATQDTGEEKSPQENDTPGFDYSAFNVLKKDGDK